MDYFFTIENTPYRQWQAEMLIESFKYFGLQDNLAIQLIPEDQHPKTEFCRNLYTHKRIKALNANIGRLKNYHRLNHLYGLETALKNGFLKQPFIVSDPACLLHAPFARPLHTAPEVTFQVDKTFTLDLIKQHIPNFEKYIPDGTWIPLGKTICFNNIPHPFFQQVINRAERLMQEQTDAGKHVWEHTDRAAWIVILMEMKRGTVMKGTHALEMSLANYAMENTLITYDGLPPYFNKAMHKYEPPAMLSLGNPLEKLASLYELYPTDITQFVSELANKCLQI